MTDTEAFLSQARSDFRVFKQLARVSDMDCCHLLHYLQMSTEKLAKSARIRIGQHGAAEHSHVAITKLLGAMKHNINAAEALGMKERQFTATLTRLRGDFDLIEKLAPATSTSGINAEYPWKLPSGRWIAPCDFDFRTEPYSSLMSNTSLLKFIECILDKFDVVFEE